MRNVLMVANQFPPMGGSGVQRTTKFVKYLQSFGWLPFVLTRSVGNMKLIDSSLLGDVPENVCVMRTAALDFSEFDSVLGLLGKVFARKILIPDGELLWAMASRKMALRLISEKNIPVIYTTSYPYSDHLLGSFIKKKLPFVRWVADFRDEWTNNPYTLDNPHFILRTLIEKKMEKMVLINADSVITNTPVMRQNFINNNPFVSEKKFVVIPNGFDKDDFSCLEQYVGNNDKFTVSYTGALYGRRKPDTFFEALKQLLNEGLVDKKFVKINLIGNYKYGELQSKIDSFGLNGVVFIHGYLEHRDCLSVLVKSDALLLLEGSGVGANAFYTGKIFEYMNSNRPVLAVIPKNGAAATLIETTNIGAVADFDNISQIKSIFLAYYVAWLSGELSYMPNLTEIKKYERKELTKMLALVFDSFFKEL